VGKKSKKETKSLGKRLNTDDNSKSVVENLKGFSGDSINSAAKSPKNSLEHGEDSQRNLTEKHDSQHSHHSEKPYSKESKDSTEGSIKARVFSLFDKYPLITAKKIGELLGLDYGYYKGYLWQLTAQHKTLLRNSRGLKGLNFHHWHGWIYALKGMNRALAVENGWLQTRARNRYLLFKTRDGRLEWHESNRIKVWIKKPVTQGKALQLLADGFFKTFLITDIRVFTEWAKDLRHKGGHCAVDTGVRLPYLKVDLFKKSNGIVLVLGDKTHPTSLEIQYSLPDYAEKSEVIIQQNTKMLEQFSKVLKDLSAPRSPPKDDRSVV